MYNPILIKTNFSRLVTLKGELLTLGTFNIPYDGTGTWFISGHPINLDKTTVDDKLLVYCNDKNITTMYSPGKIQTSLDPIDISNILEEGNNQVTIKIKDVWGDSIGCSNLYFVYVPVINTNSGIGDITPAIEYYSVTKRLNDPCTQFGVKFSIDFDPDEFVTGPDISFQLTDTVNTDDFVMYKGKIQKVGRSIVVGNKTYDITGRDNGWNLSKQTYSLNCTLKVATVSYMKDILADILKNTGIRLGVGIPTLKNIKLSNKPTDANFFGGEFNPKWKALTALFQVYSKMTGINKVRWFVDSASTLRWFEIKSNRGEIKPVSLDDDITNIDITEDATNIVNSISVTGFDSTNSVELEDKASQDKYGICEGDPVSYTDDEESQEDFLNGVQTILSSKSSPIFSGKIVFSGIKEYECGQQLVIDEDKKYGNIIFTITGVDYTGSPVKPQTTLTITTDEDEIVPTNLMESVESLIQKLTNNTTAAVVTDIPASLNPGDIILVNTSKNGTNIPVKYIGSG